MSNFSLSDLYSEFQNPIVSPYLTDEPLEVYLYTYRKNRGNSIILSPQLVSFGGCKPTRLVFSSESFSRTYVVLPV